MEPKRYKPYFNDPLSCDYFRADDPIIIEALRSHEALKALEGIIKNVEWVKISIESTGIEIDAIGGGSAAAYIRRFKVAAPDLTSAIESAQKGTE